MLIIIKVRWAVHFTWVHCLVCKLYIKKTEIYMCVCSYSCILGLIIEGQSFINLSIISSVQFSSVQWLSRVWLFATPWTAAHQASLSITYSRSLLKLMSIESVMPSNHLICRPLLLPLIFPSIRVFSNESVLCIRWPNIEASASSSVLPMNIQDWFPLGLNGSITLQSKGLSRVFSNTTVQKHQFFGSQLCLQSSSHIHTWLPEKS